MRHPIVSGSKTKPQNSALRLLLGGVSFLTVFSAGEMSVAELPFNSAPPVQIAQEQHQVLYTGPAEEAITVRQTPSLSENSSTIIGGSRQISILEQVKGDAALLDGRNNLFAYLTHGEHTWFRVAYHSLSTNQLEQGYVYAAEVNGDVLLQVLQSVRNQGPIAPPTFGDPTNPVISAPPAPPQDETTLLGQSTETVTTVPTPPPAQPPSFQPSNRIQITGSFWPKIADAYSVFLAAPGQNPQPLEPGVSEGEFYANAINPSNQLVLHPTLARDPQSTAIGGSCQIRLAPNAAQGDANSLVFNLEAGHFSCSLVTISKGFPLQLSQNATTCAAGEGFVLCTPAQGQDQVLLTLSNYSGSDAIQRYLRRGEVTALRFAQWPHHFYNSASELAIETHRGSACSADGQTYRATHWKACSAGVEGCVADGNQRWNAFNGSQGYWYFGKRPPTALALYFGQETGPDNVPYDITQVWDTQSWRAYPETVSWPEETLTPSFSTQDRGIQEDIGLQLAIFPSEAACRAGGDARLVDYSSQTSLFLEQDGVALNSCSAVQVQDNTRRISACITGTPDTATGSIHFDLASRLSTEPRNWVVLEEGVIARHGVAITNAVKESFEDDYTISVLRVRPAGQIEYLVDSEDLTHEGADYIDQQLTLRSGSFRSESSDVYSTVESLIYDLSNAQSARWAESTLIYTSASAPDGDASNTRWKRLFGNLLVDEVNLVFAVPESTGELDRCEAFVDSADRKIREIVTCISLDDIEDDLEDELR